MTTENAKCTPEDQVWLQEHVNQLTFAEALKAHRLSEEWTQTKAAEKLGISKQLLSSYETGRNVPSPKTAYHMAQHLGMLPEAAVLMVLNDQLRREELPLQVKRA